MSNTARNTFSVACLAAVICSPFAFAEGEIAPINTAPAPVVEPPAPVGSGPVNAAEDAAAAVNAAPEAKAPVSAVVNSEEAEKEVEEVSKGSQTAPAFTPINSGVARPGPAQSPPVKKSRSGECLPRGNSYYDKEQIFTPYPSIEACLASGGRDITR